MKGVTHETHRKINNTGRPATATLDQGLHSDFVTCGGRHTGRFPDWPMLQFWSHPDTIIFGLKMYQR